jgi:hypothetical protein
VNVPEPELRVSVAPGSLIALEPNSRIVGGMRVGELAYPATMPSLVGESSPEGAVRWSQLGRRLLRTDSPDPQ